MMAHNEHHQMEDVELEAVKLAFLESRERGEPVHAWLDRYPQYAPQLLDLAVAVMADERSIQPTAEETARVTQAVLRTLDRLAGPAAISSAQALAEPASRVARFPPVQNPISLAERARAAGLRMPDLARRLRLPLQVLVSLDQGYVRLETVPRQFLQYVADALQCTVDALAASLRPAPATAGMAFHTKGKPEAAQQRSFVAEIEHAPGIDPAEKVRWVAAAREEGLAA